MKKILFYSLAVLSLTACKKEFDDPPVKDIPVGMKLTVADLRAMYTGTNVHFNDDYSVYAVVTADETNGNFYKESYVQDNTGAIYLRLLSSGGLYRGDSVRIYLKGTTLKEYNGMLQLDSVDVDNNIIKQANQMEVTPEVKTIAQLTTADQAKLIKLENVAFLCSEAGNTYADAANLYTENHYLEDTLGNQLIVRTSGYANFAGNLLPSGSGSIVGVLGQYNNDLQLYIRDINEVQLNNTRFSACPFISKDFEDQSITSGGWTQQMVTGAILWSTSDQGSAGDFYGKISNWNGTNNVACETWYISPAVDLSTSNNPVLTFDNAYNYAGPQLEVYVITNFTGDVTTSTTVNLSSGVNWSTGSWAWVNSGNISLASYKQAGVRIAFRYTGTSTSGSTWEIDDVIIKEQ